MGETTKNQPVQENSDNKKFPVIIPESKGMRWLYGLATIALPTISFALTIESSAVQPDWQDGRMAGYFRMMLGGPASYCFYPMLLFAMIGMGILLFSPKKAKFFIIRLGIYTGVVLALHFSILSFANEFFYFVLGSNILYVIILPALSFGHKKLNESKKISKNWKTAIYSVFGLGFFAIFLITLEMIEAYIFMLGFGLLAAGPFICLIISLQVSKQLFNQYDRSSVITFWQRLGIFTWVSAYLVAWRFSILKAIELYSKLPTSPPDCFSATAAAHGYPKIVRSRRVTVTKGVVLCVNPQLQYLKAAEITLRSISPRIHRCCRVWYDHYGQALARKITTPIPATLAYLCLKPVEWVVRFTLGLFLPQAKEIIKRLYTT